MSKRVGIRRGEDLWAFGICRAITSVARLMTFVERLPVVFRETLQSGFRVFIHRANCRNEARVKERLHAFAELVGRALGGAGHVRFESLAARFAGGAALGVERW